VGHYRDSFFVAFASFGLGRLSALESPKSTVVSIGQAPLEGKPRGMYPGGLVVAARSGNAYYYPWCTGALKIGATNMVWFDSEDAAKKAGYTAGKGCKGLQ
jgi:hypothetical protein